MLVQEIVLKNYLSLYQLALKNNLELTIFSAYRSYQKQETLWENSTSVDEFYLAKPGHSEHQTGLALDISTRNIGLTNAFASSKEYKFLITHAHLFGFINRYPKNKEQITGYYYEPWHFRYVGIKHATAIYENNLTLEEYLETF